MSFEFRQGDWIERLREMPDESVQCCVTSPPYFGLRNYGVDGQIGGERTPQEYVENLVAGFREVKRVLRGDGTLWLNLGDSYANDGKWGGATGGKHASALHGSDNGCGRGKRNTGLKPKDLIGIPWMVAFALRADGWYLRSHIPWIKRNAMPESVKDRPGQSVESVFLLSKSEHYYFDMEAVRVPFADARNGCDGSPKKRERNRGGRVDGYTKPNGVDPSKNGGRNFRNHDLFMRSWNGLLMGDGGEPLAFVVNPKPFKGAHFAVFPPALVEPCIGAGTSEKGCCRTCSAPWERVMERTNIPNETAKGSRFDVGKTGAREGGDRTQKGERFVTRPAGWHPTCKCTTSGTASCKVLDPFSGAGTTALVAYRLDRDFIGIELNPEYVEMAEGRLVEEMIR